MKSDQCVHHGCVGDRPIELTLQRAWQALTWKQKAQLAAAALRASFTRIELDADMVERMKNDDAVSAFSSALSSHYPEVGFRSRHSC